MFNDSKGALTSVTVWGAVIAIVATGLQIAGYDLGDTNGLAEQIVAVIGGVIAVYGRLRATKKIGKS